jgi:hypothetical protein
MFRKRYRTNQLMVDTTASVIRRLHSNKYQVQAEGYSEAYSVVKFIVNVKLMENSVNSHVGSVIVVKVMSQYRAPGITLRMKRSSLPNRPSSEEPCVSPSVPMLGI